MRRRRRRLGGGEKSVLVAEELYFFASGAYSPESTRRLEPTLKGRDIRPVSVECGACNGTLSGSEC